MDRKVRQECWNLTEKMKRKIPGEKSFLASFCHEMCPFLPGCEWTTIWCAGMQEKCKHSTSLCFPGEVFFFFTFLSFSISLHQGLENSPVLHKCLQSLSWIVSFFGGSHPYNSLNKVKYQYPSGQSVTRLTFGQEQGGTKSASQPSFLQPRCRKASSRPPCLALVSSETSSSPRVTDSPSNPHSKAYLRVRGHICNKWVYADLGVCRQALAAQNCIWPLPCQTYLHKVPLPDPVGYSERKIVSSGRLRGRLVPSRMDDFCILMDLWQWIISP